MSNNDFTISLGPSAEVLKSWTPKSVHSIITSPPYWGQRDYEDKEQLGNETTVELYLDRLMSVFDEVHKVLRDDGTAWINLGDRLKDGNLVNVPLLFSERMKKNGWYYRQYFPWLKRNAIPKGGDNRPHDSLECVLMFSKAKDDYFYDQLSAKHQAKLDTRNFRNGDSIILDADADFWVFDVLTRKNWTKHFSTFPPLLAEIMVRASTSDGGCCSKCGVQSTRLLKKTRYATRSGTKSKEDTTGKAFRDKGRHLTKVEHLGWRMGCSCNAAATRATVLDPFSGMATTGVACMSLNRKYLGIEINEDFKNMSENRLEKMTPLDIFKIQ